VESFHVHQLECLTIEANVPEIAVFAKYLLPRGADTGRRLLSSPFLIGIAAQTCQPQSFSEVSCIFGSAKWIHVHEPSQRLSWLGLAPKSNLLLEIGSELGEERDSTSEISV
jgi:hypothetical protein